MSLYKGSNYCFLDPPNGNDLYAGKSWRKPKATYASATGLVSDYGNITIFVSPAGYHNVDIVGEMKTINLVGNPRPGSPYWLGYGLDGNPATTDPIIDFKGSSPMNSLKVRGFIIGTSISGKPALRFNYGTGSMTSENGAENCSLLMNNTNQNLIEVGDGLGWKAKISNNILMQFGGDVTGSHLVRSYSTVPCVVPFLIRNCAMVFVADAAPSTYLKEADMHYVDPGSQDNVQYYNCAWLRGNLDGSYTLMTQKDAYPSTALRKDPNPMTVYDFNKLAFPGGGGGSAEVIKFIRSLQRLGG